MNQRRLALISAMKMFSATVTSGQSAISWCTNPMPSSWARAGEVISTASPFRKISPLSGRRMPSMMFISVDFPAPFSPAIACISPRRSSKSTPRSAWVAPNDLLTFEILRTTSSDMSKPLPPAPEE